MRAWAQYITARRELVVPTRRCLLAGQGSLLYKPNRNLLYYQATVRKHLLDYATQRVLHWLLAGGNAKSNGGMLEMTTNSRKGLAFRRCLAIMAIVLCWHGGIAQTTGVKQLTSFCGFKAGEIKKGEKGIAEPIRARTPFRGFRDVLLAYSPKGRLQGVVALADKEVGTARKELDLCCKELARNGIRFQNWEVENDGKRFCRRGEGEDVFVIVFLDADGNKKTAASISIAVNWQGVDSWITPKDEKFKAKGNLTRKAFVEDVFGMKFGEEIPVDVKTGSGKLSSPICGLTKIVILPDPDSRKLWGVRLDGQGRAAKKSADAKPDFAGLCKDVKKWLGFARYDKENEEMFNNFAHHIVSSYNDKSIEVVVTVQWNPKWETSHFSVIISAPTAP